MTAIELPRKAVKSPLAEYDYKTSEVRRQSLHPAKEYLNMKMLSVLVIFALLIVCFSSAFPSLAAEPPSQEGAITREGSAPFSGDGGFVILVSTVAMASAAFLALKQDNKSKSKKR